MVGRGTEGSGHKVSLSLSFTDSTMLLYRCHCHCGSSPADTTASGADCGRSVSGAHRVKVSLSPRTKARVVPTIWSENVMQRRQNILSCTWVEGTREQSKLSDGKMAAHEGRGKQRNQSQVRRRAVDATGSKTHYVETIKV